MTTCSSCGTENTADSRFCGSCGATLPAPSGDGERIVIELDAGSPHAAGDEHLPGPGPADTASSQNRPATGLRASVTNPARAAAIVGGLIALVVVGWFLVQGLWGEGSGAGSPEGAVTGLADAIEHEDIAQTLNLLAPEEVRALDDVTDGASKRAEEARLVRSASDPLGGIDFSVDDLEVDSQELSDHVSRVVIRHGSLVTEVEPAGLSDATRQASKAKPSTDTIDFVEDDLTDYETFVITIKDGGRWYVSPVYTALAYYAEEQGLPMPAFDAELRAGDPAKSPTDAVKAFARAAGRIDPSGVINASSPASLAALYDFRTTLEADVESGEGLGELRTEVGFTVDDAGLREEDFGNGYRKVIIDSARGDYFNSEDSTSGSYRMRGTCFYWESAGGGDDGDSGGGCLSDPDTVLGAHPAREYGLDEAFVLVHERDGGWYVDPLATAYAYAMTIIDHADQQMVLGLVGMPEYNEPTGTAELGKSTSGSVKRRGDVDVYDLHLEAGTIITLASESPEVPLRIFGPNGQQLYAYDPYIEIQRSGAHRVVAGGGSSSLFNDSGYSFKGSYDFHVSKIETEPATIPSSIDTALDADHPVRVFDVTPPEDANVVVSVTPLDGRTDVWAILPDGDWADDSDTAVIDGGTRSRIVLTGETGASTGVRLVIEPLPADVDLDGDMSGTLAVPGGVATFRVYLTANTSHTLSAYGSDGLDTVLRLRTSDGSEVSYNDDSSGSRNASIEYTPSSSGIYTVEVSGFSGSTGSFELSVW